MNTTYAPRAATRRAVPREAGFSLLEVIIAGAILVGIITVTAILLQSGNRLLGTTSAQSEADNRAGLVAEQICTRLRDSITVTLTDGAGAPLLDGATATNGVGAQCFVNFKGGPIGGESYRFVMRNGESNVVNTLDDDRDNYVDEFDLYLQRWPGVAAGPPAADVLIGRNIGAISVTRTGRRISVVLTVLRYDAAMREVRRFVHRAEAALKN